MTASDWLDLSQLPSLLFRLEEEVHAADAEGGESDAEGVHAVAGDLLHGFGNDLLNDGDAVGENREDAADRKDQADRAEQLFHNFTLYLFLHSSKKPYILLIEPHSWFPLKIKKFSSYLILYAKRRHIHSIDCFPLST